MSQCREVFNTYCQPSGYIEPFALQDALVDYSWGNTLHNTDNLLEHSSSVNVSFDDFFRLSKKHAENSFNSVLSELNERDRAILVLTREHVSQHPACTSC